MRLLKSGILVAIMLSVSCDRPPPGQSGQSSSPRPPEAFVPVGRLIERGVAFVPEGGGYAIVLFKRERLDRRRQACNTMARSMRVRVGPADGRPVPVDGKLVYERPVYWPVTGPSEVSCASMLGNYDFERATASLRRIPNASRLGQGPFVLVRSADGRQAGLFDFSRLDGSDFDDQFAAVVNYMSQRSDVWSPDFYKEASLRQKLNFYARKRGRDAPIVLASLIRELRA